MSGVSFKDAYTGKKILVTGHTGFKGAWLCEWLMLLGARVAGYALDPPSQPSLYEQLGLCARLVKDIRGDVRDLQKLQATIEEFAPDYIFHLAAQTLVGVGYQDPVYTYETNILGTVNVLEAVRRLNHDCVVLVVTTDKVYENREWLHAYRETDPLGGYDPYSASKGCCEIVTSSYQRSFFNFDNKKSSAATIAVASCRAGNVIGGGDWAADRIVPDCVRSLAQGKPIPVRNMTATRPWQHVLEPLSGYMLLGAKIRQALSSNVAMKPAQLRELCSAFNFGPKVTSNKPVSALVREVLLHWPGEWEDKSNPEAPHEAGLLNLASDKAYHLLGWTPCWDFPETVEMTVEWYRSVAELGGKPDAERVRHLTDRQIDRYTRGVSY